MGKVVLVQKRDGQTYKLKVDICKANALCAFIYKYKNEDGETINQLVNFLCDSTHVRNLIKSKTELFFEDIERVELNLHFKECEQILKYFTQMGHRVTCYYKK